jgi:2'-5' RNA ligase
LSALTCFVVLVPEADVLVGTMRAQFDDSARRGLGAHITTLYPFMAPDAIDAAVIEKAAATIAAHEEFSFQLKSISRFPHVAYLDPTPAESFIALSLNLGRAFPLFPPYSGEYTQVVPHLTVARGDPGTTAASVDALAAALEARGPIHSVCKAVTLIENSSGRWKPLREFALEPAAI